MRLLPVSLVSCPRPWLLRFPPVALSCSRRVLSPARHVYTRVCVFEEKRRKYGGTSEGRRVKEGERGFGKMSRATSAQSRWRGGSEREREKERKAAAKVSSSSQASVAISTHQETTKEIIVMHTCLSCSGLASRVPRRRRRRRPSLTRSLLSLSFSAAKESHGKRGRKQGTLVSSSDVLQFAPSFLFSCVRFPCFPFCS